MDQELKNGRAVAKRKFTRKVNLLREAHARKDPMQVLKDIYSDVSVQFRVVEDINEELFKAIARSDPNYEAKIEELEIYITDVERVKNEAFAIMCKVENDDRMI